MNWGEMERKGETPVLSELKNPGLHHFPTTISRVSSLTGLRPDPIFPSFRAPTRVIDPASVWMDTVAISISPPVGRSRYRSVGTNLTCAGPEEERKDVPNNNNDRVAPWRCGLVFRNEKQMPKTCQSNVRRGLRLFFFFLISYFLRER